MSIVRKGWGWLKRNSLATYTRMRIHIKRTCIGMTISTAARTRYAERLNATGTAPQDTAPLISLTIPVRHLGAKNNYFERYLQELIKKTNIISNIEVLVKIDFDDDLRWFSKILNKYSHDIRLRFFVTPQEAGYTSTNYFHHFLIQKRSTSSTIWVLQSADTEIVVDGWDDVILREIGRCSSRYFICTDTTLEESISIKGPNPVLPQPVYWIRGTLFPIVSTAVLDVLGEASKGFDGWTMVGKTFNIDGFFGDMLRHLYEIHGIDVHVRVPMLFREYKAEGWHGNPRREGLRTRSLLGFFEEKTQNTHKGFAAAIARKVREEMEARQ